MKRPGALIALALLPVGVYLGYSLAQIRPPQPVTPATDTLFTSTATVTGLVMDGGGSVWAATTGGVLRGEPDGVWKKYSRQNGLPASEVQRIGLDEHGEVTAQFPRAVAHFTQGKWQVEKSAIPPSIPQAIEIAWDGSIVQATPGGLRIRPKAGQNWKPLTLPASRGSHVSALMVKDGALWLALYGDGIWSYDGSQWKKPGLHLPDAARDATALAFDAKRNTLWVGTRRGGIWQYHSGDWHQHRWPDEPLEHNAQRIATYGGALYVSTLEDGLQKRSPQGWEQLAGATLSSGATRCLVSFQNKLYVRHGGGKVDVFNGRQWTRNAFPQLPRQKAFALATDSHKLLVAQWGGWSEWNGREWAHFLRIPELQGLPVMAILSTDDTVWVGTQNRGVGEYSRSLQTFRWHDERHGLPDDWITCFARSGNTLFAGTFVGGLAFYDGKRWSSPPELAGDNVTDLQTDREGNLIIATRRGVWQRDKSGKMKKLNTQYLWLDTEAQAVWPTPQGLWVGLRTGLAFLKKTSVETRPGASPQTAQLQPQ